jgi:hypothetical protein
MDDVKVKVKINTNKKKSTCEKNKDLPVGVTEKLVHRKGKLPYIEFSTSYFSHKINQTKKKCFYAGAVDYLTERDYQIARKTAIVFRQEFEYCQKNAINFKIDKYKDFKKKHLYRFTPKELAELY